MADQQFTLAGPVGSEDTFRANGVWLTVLRLVNTLDEEVEIPVEAYTLPPGSPGWEQQAQPISAAVQRVKVPIPGNGGVEIGVMIVPDAGASLAVNHAQRITAPRKDSNEQPMKVAILYADIRNTGAEPTEVSLIYTYQKHTFNPGKGDLRGGEMTRVKLPPGEEFRIGMSFSIGGIEVAQGWNPRVDIQGDSPAVLRQVEEPETMGFYWHPLDPPLDLDLDLLLDFASESVFEWPPSSGSSQRARKVGFDIPSEPQTIITDRASGQRESRFRCTQDDARWVQMTFPHEPPKLDLFEDFFAVLRSKTHLGGGLSPWMEVGEIGEGDDHLRVDYFPPYTDEAGGSRFFWDWNFWDEARGCRRLLEIGLAILVAAAATWAVVSGREGSVGPEPTTSPVAVATTATQPHAIPAPTLAPTTSTTEALTLSDVFAPWGRSTGEKMVFMGDKFGWGIPHGQQIVDSYSMPRESIRLFFSDLSQQPGKDNVEVKIESVSSFRYRLYPDYAEMNFGNTTFGCGTFVEDRHTVCGSVDPPPEGELLFFIQHLGGPIPTDRVTGEAYVYGLVFETDGDPSNDWEAQEPYLGDTFQGTDYWYELQGLESSDGRVWILDATDIGSGAFRGETQTTARAVIWEDMIFWFIPADEVAGFTGWRFTSFVTDTANPFTAEGSAVDAVPGPPDWGLFDPPTLFIDPGE